MKTFPRLPILSGLALLFKKSPMAVSHLLFACALLAVSPSAGSPKGKSSDPKTEGSRGSLAAHPDTVFEGVRYVSTSFLEDLFGQEGGWVPDRQKYVVTDSTGRRWTFTLDNPYMNIGDEVFNLGFPVRRGPDLLYIPLPSLLRILNGRLGYSIEAPPEVLAAAPVSGDSEAVPGVKPDPEGYNIFELGTEERDNGTLVSVRTAGKLPMESLWSPPHFILKFQRGLLAPEFPAKSPGQGLVKQIHAVQEKGLAQLTLNIPKAVDTVEVAYTEDAKPG